MTRQEKIYEYLCEISDGATLDLWEEYCEDNRYDDDRVYYMDFLEDYICGMSAFEAFKMGADNGEYFNLNDDYFQFTIYGIKSFSDIFDVVDLDDLATWIDDTENTCGDRDLEELLEEYEEEDEEDEN